MDEPEPLEDIDTAFSLSDEELLLACRAYLQKKNRLGMWTLSEERKQKRQHQFKLAKGSQAGGFFWDDPFELKYYRPHSRGIGNYDGSDNDGPLGLEKNTNAYENDDEQDDNMNGGDQSSLSSHVEPVKFDFKGQSSDDRLEEWSREFSSFPAEPSESRIRRCQAAKKRWEDPEWKAKWYQKRWADKKKPTQQHKLTAAKENSPAFSMEFMASPQFIGLSEEEIVEAVAMYQKANTKRAKSLKLSRQQQKEFLKKNDPMTNENFSRNNEERVPRDALLRDRDEEERRQMRSEKQKNSYQTRLQNTRQTRIKNAQLANKRAKRMLRPTADTYSAALKRIRMDLDLRKLPQLDDLVLIASPKHLRGRRQLMLRLLAEQFNLRGKCIPDEQDPDRLIFVTNTRIERIMEFAIGKVRQRVAEE